MFASCLPKCLLEVWCNPHANLFGSFVSYMGWHLTIVSILVGALGKGNGNNGIVQINAMLRQDTSMKNSP